MTAAWSQIYSIKTLDYRPTAGRSHLAQEGLAFDSAGIMFCYGLAFYKHGISLKSVGTYG
ncbi:hypothetical protein GCM10027275_54170 [Rhabdobacter roseus]